VPDLPDFIATDATLAEVADEIRGAIPFHIDGLREDGLPVPDPSAMAGYVTAQEDGRDLGAARMWA
jgi:predicted RNase H-like HicB family nuclease